MKPFNTELEANSVASLNCHGLKGDIGYVHDLTKQNCVTCEHWLFPRELNTVQSIFQAENRWSYLKSSIDPSKSIQGRPFGGVGFVCQNQEDVSYFHTVSCRVIQIESVH